MAHAATPSQEVKSSPDIATVVVTASPITADPDHLAMIVESVDRDGILRNGGANLADALADIPGVTGTSFASGASRPVIRGFDANRVRTLEDGIGSFDVSDVGPDHGVPIDPLSADRVEVVRGAATLRYGSQAIGGVVNAINNRVPTQLGDEPLNGEMSGSYGTSWFAPHSDRGVRGSNCADAVAADIRRISRAKRMIHSGNAEFPQAAPLFVPCGASHQNKLIARPNRLEVAPHAG